MIYFSQNLVYYRELKGWTQKELAENICYKRYGIINGQQATRFHKRIGAYEEGRSTPKLSFLIVLCDLLDIKDINSFLTKPKALSKSA